jgi:O-antigen/teichoic acid export membrane protein
MSGVVSDTLAVLARRGMRDMLVRQISATLVSFGGSVVLARVLSPSDFGTYAIATFIVNIFMVFGDLGLAASFIQSEKSPGNKSFRVSFTIQLALVTGVVLLTWVLAPWILDFYRSVSKQNLWLIRIMSLLLYLPVFRSASTIQLERGLRYGPVAWAEGVGMSLYQVIAVVCAIRGLGVWSFVLATLISGIVSLIIVYRSAPWSMGLCFDWDEIRRVLRQGISFQSAALLDVFSQWAIPAIAGTLAGPTAVGYLGLALANAKRPLLLSESVMRVSFPHFSRLQADLDKLHQTINNYLIALLWVMFAWAGLLWTSSGPLVAFIYSAKWLPAVPALVIFAIALPMDVVIWTVGMSYRAMNRNWAAVKIFCVRTVVNLGLSALLVWRMGFIGIPIAYVAANTVCAMLLLYNFAPSFLPRVLRSAGWLLPCTASAYFGGRLVCEVLTDASTVAVARLIAGALPFCAIYLLCSYSLAPAVYRAKFLNMVRPLLSAAHGTIFNLRRRSENFGYIASED